MVKKIVIVLVLLVVLLLGVGLVLPTDYALARSLTIEADAAAVHEYVGDLKNWPEWIPWTEDDPTIKTTYGDTTTGVGAHQSWTAEDGDGELTFTKCDSGTGVAYDMAFIVGETRIPSTSEMTYEKVGGGTLVTWTMEGDVDGMMFRPIDGWMNIFMSGSIESMFDRGLNKLKETVEKK
jgi:hypothetical protein